MPLKCDFGQKEFPCVSSVLNVRAKKSSLYTVYVRAARVLQVSCIRWLHVALVLRSLNLAADVNPA